MKPPAFTYHRPATVVDALQTLAELGADAKVLAGGQSLVPLLNMRLAAPGHLVDINRLTPWLGAVRGSDGGVEVGALVRHAELERSDVAFPLLREATRHVAHAAIRNRGTTVGSIAHADPAAELPAVLLLCQGTVRLASATGERTLPAAQFLLGPLETALRPGELVLSAHFPAFPARTGTAWVEVSRRAGDFALCGLGLAVTLSPDQTVAQASAAYSSVGPTPVRIDLTDAVHGQPAETADWSAAGELASAQLAPEADIHASAAYRRHLVGVLTRRAGRIAARRAAAHD